MVAAHPLPPEVPPTAGPVLLHGVSWQRYDALVRLFGDDYPALRLTYLEGTLEIATTSLVHEHLKKRIARLLEMWAVERGVPLNGFGAATFRKEAAERGCEPDECYVLGALVDVPDIAIEVVHRHGGIDKLLVYAGLGVPEVWFWEEGRFALYALRGAVYEAVERSGLLPALDLAELASFVARTDQTEVVRAYRDAVGQLALRRR